MTTRTPITRASATAWPADNKILRTDGTGRDGQASPVDLDDDGNMQVPNGAAIRAGTSAADTLLLQARDVDGAAWSTFFTLTSADTPTADLADGVTKGGGNYIYRAGGTDVPVADGGTGASTAEAARTNLVVGLPPGFVSVRVSQAADTDHDITFAAGKCRNDTDTFDLVLAAALTKQIDAAWAVGTNQGGLDTGTVGNTTIYYLWVIARSDTGVVDALFSTSATSPTMPASYDRKQRVGFVRTDGSANILAFVQAINDLDEFRYTTPLLDVSVTNLAEGTRTSFALSVPPTSEALFRAAIRELTAYANVSVVITPLTETDAAPALTAGPLYSLADLGSGYYSHIADGGEFRVETNASSQIAARMDSVGDVAADIGFYVATKGAKFRRGILP